MNGSNFINETILNNIYSFMWDQMDEKLKFKIEPWSWKIEGKNCEFEFKKLFWNLNVNLKHEALEIRI